MGERVVQWGSNGASSVVEHLLFEHAFPREISWYRGRSRLWCLACHRLRTGDFEHCEAVLDAMDDEAGSSSSRCSASSRLARRSGNHWRVRLRLDTVTRILITLCGDTESGRDPAERTRGVSGHLVLLHLSDIHFVRSSGGVYDLDADLRNELELDAQRVREELGEVDAVVVSGDIAFSGSREEFAIATEWLRSFTSMIGCEMHRVWVTPGNHDVEWSAIDGSTMLQAVRKELLTQTPATVDAELSRHLQDSGAGPMLFSPLNNYNEFADRFGCRIGPDVPYWESPLKLNDDWTLCLRGLNSVLTSGRDDEPKRLILGAHQATPQRKPRVVYLTVCHHPPSWLLDRTEVETLLNARSKIQLFGHEHDQVVRQVDETLVVTAGAVHPERSGEPWEPRYNWLVVRVSPGADGKPALEVELCPRVWNRASKAFEAEYHEDGKCSKYSLGLDEPEEISRPGEEADGREEKSTEPEDPDTGSEEREDVNRNLNYHLFNIPYIRAFRIASELGLSEETDRHQAVNEQLNQILERAVQRGLVEELRERVDKAEQEG